MPSAARDMPWGECLLGSTPPPPELVARVRREHGAVPDWVVRLGPAPWVGSTLSSFTSAPLTALPIRLWDLISLVVSRDNSCRFCYGAQRTFLKLAGYRDGEIDSLDRDLDTADVTPAERTVLEFARKVSRASPRPSVRDREALVRAGLSPLAIAEAAFAAAHTVFANRLATLVALPPESFEAQVDRPAFRLVLPLLRPLLRRRIGHRLRPPEPLPVPNVGLGSSVVAALAGSPAAAVLRRALDDAMASPVLPARTKLLMLGVVARAVGCARGEEEARTALGQAGVGADEVADAFAHLASPWLSPLEARLVPFARETVHCQPLPIQARMREVSAGLSPAQTVEVAGVLALANAACRVSVLLELC